ncbi:carbohydrate-binding family 9-like protein [Kamptonema cortianum]|nr:carbohydrate-binding family 9-like protein [Geitlerinema splendidum]MDK3157631.1 carbohydrate-binding family 9-like protein [Kamptonema cortianum]
MLLHPPGYICPKTPIRPSLQALAHDPAWNIAPWINEFVDIRGEKYGNAPQLVSARMMWDDDYLYLSAGMQETHLYATQEIHDSDVFLDNAFELFLDPDGDGHHYFEWEVNVLGTTLDLVMDRPYICGGTRDDSWEIPGKVLHVLAEGSVNDASSEGTGWSFAAAFPWRAFGNPSGTGEPPRIGDQWRFNLMKVAWPIEVEAGVYRKKESESTRYWVLAPTGVEDIHRPHFWGYIQFEESADSEFRLDPLWEAKYDLAEACGLTSHARSEPPIPREPLPENVRIRESGDGWTLETHSKNQIPVRLSSDGLVSIGSYRPNQSER